MFNIDHNLKQRKSNIFHNDLLHFLEGNHIFLKNLIQKEPYTNSMNLS